MDKIVNLQNVKRKLELVRCKKCNKYPVVTINGNSLSFNCCCDSFKKELARIANAEIDCDAKTNIEKQLNSIFKKH